MHRDGRIEPLTALAELIAVAALGLAAGCALFVRHRHRSTWGREFSAEVRARYVPAPFVHGPSQYRP
jgi:hypothetical protein